VPLCISVEVFHIEFEPYCEMVYTVEEKARLSSYIIQALLRAHVAENWNYPVILINVSHIEFQQNPPKTFRNMMRSVYGNE
jgi:hypothetical protein